MLCDSVTLPLVDTDALGEGDGEGDDDDDTLGDTDGDGDALSLSLPEGDAVSDTDAVMHGLDDCDSEPLVDTDTLQMSVLVTPAGGVGPAHAMAPSFVTAQTEDRLHPSAITIPEAGGAGRLGTSLPQHVMPPELLSAHAKAPPLHEYKPTCPTKDGGEILPQHKIAPAEDKEHEWRMPHAMATWSWSAAAGTVACPTSL